MDNNTKIKEFETLLTQKDFEIEKLKALTKQNESELEKLKITVTELNKKNQFLENQIVQLLSCGDTEKAKIIEQFKKDLLAHDSTYFEHFIEHCDYSNSSDKAMKKA